MHTLNQQNNRRVLVIDDNRSIHDDFRKILASKGPGDELKAAEAAFFEEVDDTELHLDVELDGACQGQEGLEKVVAAVADHRPYALAFVDMRMPPGWDGITTIEQLWKADPDLQVVICTAYSDKSWSDICRRLGRTDQLLILKKPFDNAEVWQLALALTEKWQLTQQARLRQDELMRLVDERTAQLREAEASLRQQQKLEAIGSLAGGIAHEFNNLLQVIRGNARFAMDELPADEQPYQDLTNVVDAVDRAAAITSQLLSFSRKKPVQKSNRAVNEVVATTLKLVRPVIGEQIELDVTFGDNAGTVCVDADIMSQAMLNLCVNARDAMPSGGRLRITTEQVELGDRRQRIASPRQPELKPGHYSMLTVADTGLGIPAEVRDRIFDPFFTTKEVGKGSGMGLAMVFGAVQDHDGAVTVESAEGQGSAFRLFLPVVPNHSEDAPRPAGKCAGLPANGNETILVADDDLIVRGLAVRALREAGYTTISADDGEQAVQLFEQHAERIDLVLLDVVMPKMNGRLVYQTIKGLRPETEIVFCSGYDPAANCGGLAMEKGWRLIQKPYDPDELLLTVREVLDARQPWQAPIAIA